MAKDLPYFKFFCSEWNDGDITLESYKIQGVFINVCSYYWSKECDVNYDKLLKRFKDCKEELDALFSENLIKKEDDNVIIAFLDEQQEERDKTSNRNSLAGKKSAEKRRLKKLNQQQSNEKATSVEIPFNENSTNKRREEKRRKEIYVPTEEEFMIYAKGKVSEQDYPKIRNKLILRYNSYIENDWKDARGTKIKNWKNKCSNAIISLL